MTRSRCFVPCICALLLTEAGCNADKGAPPAVDDAADAASREAGSAQPAGWDSQLQMPEATDLNPDPNIVEVNLEARVEDLQILPGDPEGGPGPTTSTWTYNGSVPGPVIRTKKGDRLIVHFKNSLPEPTTIHWHGVRVPNAMDGTSMVQNPIDPGESFDYDFVVPDSGTYWYHPHFDSSSQVGYGLYGTLIVEDPSEPFLGDELTIVLSDMSLEGDGTLDPGDQLGWFGAFFGREGYTELVNGRVAPNVTLTMRSGLPQRWRIIDESRARFQTFSIPNVTLTRIAGDDGLSAAPYPVSEIDLTPGEREEVVAVANAPPGTTLTAIEQTDDRFHVGVPMPTSPLMTVQVTDDAPWTGAAPVPSNLAPVAPIDVTNAPVRQITFDEVFADDAGDSADAAFAGSFSSFGINGISSTDMTKMATVTVHVGDTEIWNITNTTSQDHPFHMHGFPFQVLSIHDAAPPVLEWRDNVKLEAYGTLRIAVTFDRPGMWMFHCHILDHADMGMMAMLVVEPSRGDAGDGD